MRRLGALRDPCWAIALAVGLLAPWHVGANTSTFDPVIQEQFVRSLALVEQGEYPEAISILRDILNRDPKLNRVRLELARAYFLAEEWELARREFFTVLSSDIPSEVRAKILAFLRAIDDRRGWSWGIDTAFTSGQYGFRKYRSDKVTLNVGGQPLEFEIDRPDPPDYGIHGIGYIEARSALNTISDSQRTFGLGFGVTADIWQYTDSDWDDYTVGLANRLIVTYPETTFEVGPSASYRWLGQESYEQSLGGDARVANRSVTDWTLSAAGTGRYINNKITHDRDGNLIGVQIGGLRSVGGTSILGLSLNGLRFDASAPYESYYEFGVSPYMSSDFGYGITATLIPSYITTKYDERAPLFFDAREDWEAGFRVQIVKNDYSIEGYSPFVSYAFAYHDSNIELYQYTDNIFQVGFTKNY